ncbi:MAG: 50S ribosomal protein L15 [Ignavibacteriae bacterium]|nr:50S ribosomal protein L15 [Ignavibacteriota bacterium]
MAKDILSNLTPARGSRKKRKRIGRGQGSGHGGTATRGHKGAGSRSGTRYVAGFEGGQMPLVRRVPKRGFTSPFRIEYQVVNVETLERLATDGKVQDGLVNPEILVKIGVVKKKSVPVKILGNGELKAKLNVSAHAFSKSALAKIETAGGKAQTISSSVKE